MHKYIEFIDAVVLSLNNMITCLEISQTYFSKLFWDGNGPNYTLKKLMPATMATDQQTKSQNLSKKRKNPSQTILTSFLRPCSSGNTSQDGTISQLNSMDFVNGHNYRPGGWGGVTLTALLLSVSSVDLNRHVSSSNSD